MPVAWTAPRWSQGAAAGCGVGPSGSSAVVPPPPRSGALRQVVPASRIGGRRRKDCTIVFARRDGQSGGRVSGPFDRWPRAVDAPVTRRVDPDPIRLCALLSVRLAARLKAWAADLLTVVCRLVAPFGLPGGSGRVARMPLGMRIPTTCGSVLGTETGCPFPGRTDRTVPISGGVSMMIKSLIPARRAPNSVSISSGITPNDSWSPGSWPRPPPSAHPPWSMSAPTKASLPPNSSTPAATRVPSCSFEPLGAEHAALVTRAQAYPTWTVAARCALGDADGETTIHRAGNSVSSSLLPMREEHVQAAPGSQMVADESVMVRRLDQCPEAAGTYRWSVILLKLDTQGFELPRAAPARRRSCRGFQGMVVERSLVPLYEGGALLGEVLEAARHMGFHLHDLFPDSGHPAGSCSRRTSSSSARGTEAQSPPQR